MAFLEFDSERLITALKCETPDRVPIFEELFENRIVDYVLGRDAEYIEEKESLVKRSTRAMTNCADYIEFAQKVGLDAIVAYAWNGGIGGSVVRKASDGSAHYIGGDIKNWRDLEKVSPFEGEKVTKNIDEYLRLTQDTKLGICAWLPGLFTPVIDAMGYEDFFIKIHDDLEFIEHLMDIQCERSRKVAQLICRKKKVSFVCFGDDISDRNDTMVHPNFFEKEWIPRMERIIEPCKKNDIPVILHECGNNKHVLPMAKEIGFDGLQPLAECNDIYKLGKEYNGEICLLGSIPLSILISGTKKQVIEVTKKHIDYFGERQNGGFVIGSSHSINNLVPPENYLAMIEAVHRYGSY